MKNVGVNPNHGVYFSKAPYEGNPEELRALFIDPKLLEKMNLEGSSRKVTQYKVMFFCVLAMSYLTWTCTFLFSLYDFPSLLLQKPAASSSGGALAPLRPQGQQDLGGTLSRRAREEAPIDSAEGDGKGSGLLILQTMVYWFALAFTGQNHYNKTNLKSFIENRGRKKREGIEAFTEGRKYKYGASNHE